MDTLPPDVEMSQLANKLVWKEKCLDSRLLAKPFPYQPAGKTCIYDPDNEIWFGGEASIEKFKVPENI